MSHSRKRKKQRLSLQKTGNRGGSGVLAISDRWHPLKRKRFTCLAKSKKGVWKLKKGGRGITKRKSISSQVYIRAVGRSALPLSGAGECIFLWEVNLRTQKKKVGNI